MLGERIASRSEVIRAIWMLEQCIASLSEAIRAIMSDHSPCCEDQCVGPKPVGAEEEQPGPAAHHRDQRQPARLQPEQRTVSLTAAVGILHRDDDCSCRPALAFSRSFRSSLTSMSLRSATLQRYSCSAGVRRRAAAVGHCSGRGGELLSVWTVHAVSAAVGRTPQIMQQL